jgi:two-component system, LuxR family, response regulator FixJ
MVPPMLVVVDNDASVRIALEKLLQAAGYRVETHASAEAFLQSGRPSEADCLLLDVRMSGMSGLELQEELARLGLGIPIVFITGHAESSMRRRAQSRGPVEFLEKPFDDEALLAAVERVIKAAPYRPDSGPTPV